MTKKIIFFDTETTGFVQDRSKIWRPDDSQPCIVQLACIYSEFDFAEKKIIDRETFDILCKSIKPIPDKLTEIHGISNEMVKDLPTASECDRIKWFIKIMSNADLIVWHNINYDLDMMLLEARRAYPTFDFTEWFDECKKKSIDTMMLSIDLCKLPNARWWYKRPKLTELYKVLFGEEFDNAHNALADIEATEKCFYNLYEKWIIKI